MNNEADFKVGDLVIDENENKGMVTKVTNDFIYVILGNYAYKGEQIYNRLDISLLEPVCSVCGEELGPSEVEQGIHIRCM